ncbi:Hypothetical_protein [Hexamita inflata]|uniref:Hypothetical_protein n=1 Tax=Hexamita inflata TaxID=28002 RepID=A0AA86PTV1_9EUKA|nr:Hypothetical protein HINF_LOCUS28494 [Hexamita inflata]CAI9958229.1 Hypothetical protein HINF_LOCUS45874 [Hexamita inflata]CAI9958230.1 Hypothetical protein HINF_LOCUS45875 [Hexamita inflata]
MTSEVEQAFVAELLLNVLLQYICTYYFGHCWYELPFNANSLLHEESQKQESLSNAPAYFTRFMRRSSTIASEIPVFRAKMICFHAVNAARIRGVPIVHIKFEYNADEICVFTTPQILAAVGSGVENYQMALAVSSVSSAHTFTALRNICLNKMRTKQSSLRSAGRTVLLEEFHLGLQIHTGYGKIHCCKQYRVTVCWLYHLKRTQNFNF